MGPDTAMASFLYHGRCFAGGAGAGCAPSRCCWLESGAPPSRLSVTVAPFPCLGGVGGRTNESTPHTGVVANPAITQYGTPPTPEEVTFRMCVVRMSTKNAAVKGSWNTNSR